MLTQRLFEFVVLSSLICGMAGMLVLGSMLISEPPAPTGSVVSVSVGSPSADHVDRR